MGRILLIEDEQSAQLLFRNRLEDLGHEVSIAPTGARGLMEARTGTFDLFLVDVVLGSGIDGFEVCRRIKTIPQVQRIPIVLISGQLRGREDLHKGYEAGCEAFLLKGDLPLLEDVVRAMLNIKALQDDLAMQNRLLEDQNRRLTQERQRGAPTSSWRCASRATARACSASSPPAAPTASCSWTPTGSCSSPTAARSTCWARSSRAGTSAAWPRPAAWRPSCATRATSAGGLPLRPLPARRQDHAVALRLGDPDRADLGLRAGRPARRPDPRRRQAPGRRRAPAP
jgi:CheY-like chemotaxis protein